MELEFLHPRYQYHSDYFSSIDFYFSDIIDHDQNVFLSSTGIVERVTYGSDWNDMISKDDERHDLHKVADALSNDYYDYVVLLMEYAGITETINTVAPPPIHTTIFPHQASNNNYTSYGSSAGV